MTKTSLARIILTIFLALAVSAVLAPLAAAAVSAFITHSPCAFGTVPRLIESSPGGNNGASMLVCMNASGDLYTMDKMLFLNWLLFFAPVFVLFFILIFRSRWIHKLSIHK